jgi:hypothetical protein
VKNIYKKLFLIIPLAIILIYFTPYLSKSILHNETPKSTSKPKTIKSVPEPKTYIADSENITKLLNQHNKNKEHPRLMAREEDFKNIRLDISKSETMKKNFNYLKSKADAILKEEPVKYELSDGVRLLPVSRKVLTRIQTLAFVYNITGNTDYAERASLELETISDDTKFPNWHPDHFLDTAEMTNAAAIGYDWLYNYLTDSQKSLIRDAILNKGLKPAIEFSKEENSPMNGDTNWNSVCNGGIALGALAIGDEGGEFEAVSGEVLQNAVKYLPNTLNNYNPDGAWYEGPWYWDYGTTYSAYFISSLDSALGTDYDLAKSPGLASTGYFPIYTNGPGGIFNFYDSSSEKLKSPVLLWLSNKFKNGEYLLYDKENTVSDTTPMTFIWGYKKVKETPIKEQDRYFRKSEFVTLHSAINKKSDSFIGFKAGTNNLSHSDLDIGTFVYDSLGVRWFCDLGPDDYNLPGYWDMGVNGKRWEYYRKRAEGQNTLVINPSSKPDQNVYAQTKINTFKASSKKSFAIADITDAYKTDASSVKRGVALYKNNGTMIVQDEITTYNTSDIWWFAHTEAKIEIGKDKRSAILSRNDKKVLVSISSPDNGYFEKMNAEPLPTSPNPSNQAHNNMNKLAIHLANVKDTTISVTISPLVNNKDIFKPNLIRLQDWNEYD